MKKFLKIFLRIIGVLILIVIAAFAYLNFIYLPQKVKSEGAAYLEQKSKGRLRAESIQYIPFKGVKLKRVSLVSKKGEPILSIDKLYLNVDLWPLITGQIIDFRIDLYPAKIKKPFVFKGLYQIKKQELDLDFEIASDVFLQRQTITGRAKVLIDREERSDIDLTATSRDLNLQGKFYIENKDLRIDKLSAKILGSTFDFIGDVQNLSEPSLNIYGDLDINLAGLKKINPEYTKAFNKLKMDGHCLGEVLISGEPSNPQIGLKIRASQIEIEKIKIESLSIISQMENKKVTLSKLYAGLCEGEVKLDGSCRLDVKDFPTNLNLNVFNLELGKIFNDVPGKNVRVHGRLFSLGRLKGYLKRPKSVEGEIWASASGSNILQLRLFREIAEILRLPELLKVEFSEASGNFSIAKEAIRTDDLKIVSKVVALYFKGYMDFAGNLGFDIEPAFSESFLATPHIGNILGIFIDSTTGAFLGEIKLKGNIKEPRYTFKPISADKFFPKALEKGLKQLFKFKKN